MSHRPPVRLRLIGALVGVAAVSSLVITSAPPRGGNEPDPLGAGSRDGGYLTAIQIEWNPDTPEVVRPGSVRVSALDGEAFEPGGVVDVTAFGSGSDSCSGRATSTTRAAVVDLEFSACGVMLWDLQRVAVSVSDMGGDSAPAGREKASRGGLASFTGPVLQRDATEEAHHSLTKLAALGKLPTLRLPVGDAAGNDVVGARLIVILSAAGAEPIIFSGAVGTATNNQGIWVEKDPETGESFVAADVIRLAGGPTPGVVESTQYRMVLVQSQRLGVGQNNLGEHAIITADGAIEG